MADSDSDKPDLAKLREQLAGLSPEERAALGLPVEVNSGSGATASGEHSIAGGEKSIVIGGSVFGNVTLKIEPENGKLHPRVLLRDYLRRLQSKTEFLKIDVIDQKSATESKRLQLAAVYTDLKINHHRSPGGMLEEVAQRFVDEVRPPAILPIASDSRFVLLGDPGSGKSTFVEMLALCLAGEILGHETLNANLLGDDWELRGEDTPLPILVILRNFAAEARDSGDWSLWKHVERSLGDANTDFAPLLKKHLVESGGMLLIDGLDEVPEADGCRDQVRDAILKFHEDFGEVRILLTSRTYAYQNQDWKLPGFSDAVLAPFEEEQWDAFIERWYNHLVDVRNLDPARAETDANDLKTTIERSQQLQELAARPLLLTLMASLHALGGGTLPKEREKLYERSVELLLQTWERAKRAMTTDGEVLQTESAAEFLKVESEDFLRALERIAYEAHRDQQSLTGTADIAEPILIGKLTSYTESKCDHELVAAYLHDRAGILIHESPGADGVYRFPHRTFQEYLAARWLSDHDFPDELCRLTRKEPEKWREAFLLAGAKANRGSSYAAWALAGQLCQRAELEDEADAWAALLAGQLLEETGIHSAAAGVDQEAIRKRVIAALVQVLEKSALGPVDRVRAGTILGLLGDPRPGVCDLENIEWLPIAEGYFKAGYKKTRRKIKEPFEIARFPVTVAQFDAFLAADGYHEERWWTNGRFVRFDRPENYSEIYQTPNHPQVGVSWYEAMAFCDWLSEQRRQTITLPTEWELERAARHTDGRKYPWAD
ncbi:MAG: SUMF1/EgtB/PvdO family nonheme iron enzyme, partial [Verrucomicrobiota bacterium]